jgi:hypothetical protein
MTALRAGMKVVCVNARPCPVWGALSLRKGAVYTVVKAFDVLGEFSVCLEEDQSPHITGAYRASRFRPAVERKTDISIFKAMLSPAKKRERV